MDGLLTMVGIFLLRIGLPLALTLAVGYALRRLDAKWQAEAISQWKAAQLTAEKKAELEALKSERPCWELKGCDQANRAKCPACKAWHVPCWVARLRAIGRLPPECRGCELFSLVPVRT